MEDGFVPFWKGSWALAWDVRIGVTLDSSAKERTEEHYDPKVTASEVSSICRRKGAEAKVWAFLGRRATCRRRRRQRDSADQPRV